MKSSVERIRKLLQLPPSDRVVLVQAWALLLLVRLILHVLPFKTVRAFCQHVRARPEGPPCREIHTDIQRVARLVDVAGRYHLVTSTCLTEAMTLARLLGHRGITTAIRIGVAHQGGHVIAHAWLEREGRPIYGLSDESPYAPLVPVGTGLRQ